MASRKRRSRGHLEWALKYLELGWPIIPVGDNRDAKVKWREFQTRLPTRDEILRWWGRWPEANIAIVTGALPGVVVVDIDQRNGGTLADERHAGSPTGLAVKTPGGMHLYYRHPGSRIKNSADPSTGTDVRGDGGIALLPPSRRPHGVYEWIEFGEPAQMPRWVHERDTQFEIDERVHDKATTVDTSETWVEQALAEGPIEGSRNQTAARLAGHFALSRVDKSVAIEVLRGWNAKGNGLEDRELLKTIESIYDRESLKPESRFEPIDLIDDVEEETRIEQKAKPVERTAEPKPAKKSQKEIENERRKKRREKRGIRDETKNEAFGLMRHRAFLEEFATDEEWLFENWMPDETIAMLVAAPGSRKTWVELDLAICIAGGGSFMGSIRPRRVGPVIMVQQEDSPAGLQSRIATIQAVRDGLAKPVLTDDELLAEFHRDLPIYYHVDAKLRLDSEESLDAMEAAIKKIRPVAVFLDPLYSAVSVKNNMEEAPAAFIRLKQIRKRYGCSFIIVHHRVKGGRYGREGGWGSQLLNGAMETGLQMYKLKDGRSIIDRHTKMSGELDPAVVEFDINTGCDWKYETKISYITSERARELVEEDNESSSSSRPSGGRKSEAKKDANPSPLKKFDMDVLAYMLTDIGRAHARSPSQIAKALSGLHSGATPARTIATLQKLKLHGKVFKNGAGWSASMPQ